MKVVNSSPTGPCTCPKSLTDGLFASPLPSHHVTHRSRETKKSCDLDTVHAAESSLYRDEGPLRYPILEASASVKMSDAAANEAEKNIEIWKVKKLIRRLEAARGNGTSMISLIIRECSPVPSPIYCLTRAAAPKDQISRSAKMLAEEYVRQPLNSFSIGC